MHDERIHDENATSKRQCCEYITNKIGAGPQPVLDVVKYEVSNFVITTQFAAFCLTRGSHASFKVLEFFISKLYASKVLKNRFGPRNTLNLSYWVLESLGIFFSIFNSVNMQVTGFVNT